MYSISLYYLYIYIYIYYVYIYIYIIYLYYICIYIYMYNKVNLSSFQPLPILLFLPELPGPGERATHQGDLGQGRERGLDGESPD